MIRISPGHCPIHIKEKVSPRCIAIMNSPHFEIILWKIYVGKIELSDKIINEIIQVKPTLYFGVIIFIQGIMVCQVV